MCWLSFLSMCMKINTKLLKFFKMFFMSLKRHLWYHPLYFWISGLSGNKPEYLPLFQNQHSSLKVPLNPTFHGLSADHFLSHLSANLGFIDPPFISNQRMFSFNCILPSVLCPPFSQTLCNPPPWIPSWGPASCALRPLSLHQLHQGWLTAICIFKHNCCPHRNPTIVLWAWDFLPAHPSLTRTFRGTVQEALSEESSPLPLLVPEHCLVSAQESHAPE